MYFVPESGKIYCEECAPSGFNYRVSASVVQAMRYVTLSDFEKIFSFVLNDESQKVFGKVSEAYLLQKTQRKFNTLDFYRVLTL